jgi:hypothetical protein
LTIRAGARAKGDRGRADMLFSRIVRSRGPCERCGVQGTDTAHIIGRRYSATRCVEDNAWCLCRSCHQLTAEFPHEFMWLVERTIGVRRYMQLHDQAQGGIPGSSKLFWEAEVERLLVRCAELGIDTRWKVGRELKDPA